MSFKPPFTATVPIANKKPLGISHSFNAPSQKNIKYHSVQELRDALRAALKNSQPGPQIGQIFSQTDLAVFMQLGEKGQPSIRDIKNFLRVPNHILKKKEQAAGSEQIAKGFFQAVFDATNSESEHIVPMFTAGFYGISSHPDDININDAIATVDLAQKCFFKHFSLFISAFLNTPFEDILWKRLEEFLRIVIMPLSGAKPKEAAALVPLDPITFAEEFAFKIGQEWAKKQQSRQFDDRQAKIWGQLAAVSINSLNNGLVHQTHNNNGQKESLAVIPYFMLLALIELYPAAAQPVFTAISTPMPINLTGKEKSLTRQQLLQIATPLQQAIKNQATSADETKALLAKLYQSAVTKIFISPSQGSRAVSGFSAALIEHNE